MLETAAWADVSLGLLHETYADELPARRQMLDVLLTHGGRALSTDSIDHETLLGELSRSMPWVSRTSSICRRAGSSSA